MSNTFSIVSKGNIKYCSITICFLHAIRQFAPIIQPLYYRGYQHQQPGRQNNKMTKIWRKKKTRLRLVGKCYLAEVCAIVGHILAFSLPQLFRKMTKFGPPARLQTRLGTTWQSTARIHQTREEKGREVTKPGDCSDIDNHIKAEVRHY